VTGTAKKKGTIVEVEEWILGCPGVRIAVLGNSLMTNLDIYALTPDMCCGKNLVEPRFTREFD
jgi:hypothetical protein